MQFFHFCISLGLVLGLAFWLFRKLATDGFLRLIFWPALLLRLLAGLLLGLFYAQTIGDTWKYQKTANLLTAVGFTDWLAYSKIILFNAFSDNALLQAIPYPLYTNSFFLIKIVSLLNFITGSNYYLNSLFLSFFSLAGSFFLVAVWRQIKADASLAATVGLLFFPTVVFWNSGVMKDGLLLSVICFFWALVLQMAYAPGKNNFWQWLLLLITGVLLWKLKFFVAAFVFALTGSWFLLHVLYRRFRFFREGSLRWVAGILLVCLVVFAASQLHYKFNLKFLLTSLVLNNQLFREMSVGRPLVDLSGLEPTIPSVLRHAPEALAGVFFRPFFWEGNNLFYRLAALENLALLVLFLGAAASFRIKSKFPWHSFYLVLLLFGFCLALAFGLSTPNLGSLNRYRTLFLPFVIWLLLETPFWRHFLNRIRIKLRAARR